MKPFLIYIFAFLMCVPLMGQSDMSEIKKDKNNPKAISLEGTWELVGYYNYMDNKVTDSFKVSDGYRQIKMYTPTKVMWSRDVPKDSMEWYGYGEYKVTDSHLTEVLEYGSESMSNIIDEKGVFHFELKARKNSYSQIELDEEGNRVYSENYKRIE